MNQSAERFFLLIVLIFDQMIKSNSQQQCKKILERYHFETIRKLGKGSYGQVLLTSKFVNVANFFAIKCINLKKFAKDPKLKTYIQQQIETMSSLDHHNIVRLYNNFSDAGWYFFVMEYCDMNTLHVYQSKLPSKVFPLPEATKVFHQILNGLKAIHSNNIIHRDIKCDNIFLSKKKNGGFICKIGDFGFAKFIESTAITNCGTNLYMAPQIMLNQGYDKKADIWSVGVVLFNVLLGQYPFKNINIQKEIYDKCGNGYYIRKYQPNIEKKFTKKQICLLQDFFKKTFQINPQQRISLSEMSEHPLLNIPQTELSTDSTSDDQLQNEAEWQKNQIKYLLHVQKQIKKQKNLDHIYKEAFYFYVNKIIKMFLKETTITKYTSEQPTRKIAQELQELRKQNQESLYKSMNYLEKYHAELKKINKFFQGFNLYHEDFNSFKQGYRNTVSKIFQEIHSKIPDCQKRSALKFKIFTCHLINRIFKNETKKQIFPHYQLWLKSIKKPTSKDINFTYFTEWINQENSDKLLQSIEILNKTFYYKE